MVILKKLLIVFCLLLIFTINISAFDISYLTVDAEFVLFSENPTTVSKILKMDESSLKNKIKESSIIYLAVNKSNTKQIQIDCKETEFSTSVKNLSNLSNDNINALLPSIIGADNIKGKIIYKNSDKFVRTDVCVGKNENECILTQFFTVVDSKMYTISFYTNINESTDYVDKTFTVTNEPENFNEDEKTPIIKIVVIISTVIFGLICLILIFTIIKDLILSKKSD